MEGIRFGVKNKREFGSNDVGKMNSNGISELSGSDESQDQNRNRLNANCKGPLTDLQKQDQGNWRNESRAPAGAGRPQTTRKPKRRR
jgi:hypothetical protein